MILPTFSISETLGWARERARDLALDVLDAAAAGLSHRLLPLDEVRRLRAQPARHALVEVVAAATEQRHGLRICRWCCCDEHTAACPIGIAVAAIKEPAL